MAMSFSIAIERVNDTLDHHTSVSPLVGATGLIQIRYVAISLQIRFSLRDLMMISYNTFFLVPLMSAARFLVAMIYMDF